MSSALWFAAAFGLLLAGSLGTARRLARAGVWLFLASLGLALVCVFLGILRQAEPPLGASFWLRLTWTTAALTVPSWVHFSYRFGRDPASSRSSEKPVLFLLWCAAAILVVLGFSRPPLALNAELDRFILAPPLGRLVAVHILAGLIVALWNFHATLETARSAGRSRITHVIYATLPILVIVLYLTADLLLYSEQPRAKTLVLVPAAIISSVAFVGALGRKTLTEADLPVGRPVVYSSLVLTALGFLFLAMALIAETLRHLGVELRAAWQEQIATATVIVAFALVILPGVRAWIRRFVDRNFYVSRFDYRSAWEDVNGVLADVRRREDLAPAIREYLRGVIGPVRLQIWLQNAESGDFQAGSSEPSARMAADHPLVGALASRVEPLILPPEASEIDEIPLLLSCEGLAQQGLRIFFPLRGGGRLLGILGCGSGAGRPLHSEDVDLLRAVAAQLSTLAAASTWNRPAGDRTAWRGSAHDGEVA